MRNMKSVLFLLCLWNVCLFSETGKFTTNFTDPDSVYIDENTTTTVENNTSGIELKGNGDNQVKVYFTNNLIVQNNSGSGSGVGVSIENIGEVYFSNAVFNNNKANGFSSSGAALSVIDVKTVNFNNTSFTGNSSSGLGSYGGALYIGNVGNANFLDVEFNNNISLGSGGALYVEYAKNISFKGSSFTGNDSKSEGGAVYIENVGNANFLGTEFTDNMSVGHGGAVYIEDAGNVNFESSIFANNTSDLFGGAIYAKNTDNINLSNVEFSGNNAASGGAISFRDVGNANFSSVIFSGNKSTLLGGAISMYRVDSSSFLNTEFKNNISGSEGGAVYMKSSSDITFNNTLFDGNKAVSGGAIFMDDIDGISISNSKFLGNVSTEKGGAIYLIDVRDINLSNTLFKSNKSGLGGALYVDSISSINFNNLNFIGNSATQNGGAIYTTNGKFGMTNIFFDGNTAIGDGGAIYINGTDFTMSESVFSDNSSTADGGAIYIEKGSLLLTSTSFIGNSALNGGALSIAGGDSILSNANFVGNSSLNGGAVHQSAGNFSMTNSMFISNKSTQNGGALDIAGGDSILSSVNFVGNSALNGGAIHQSAGNFYTTNSMFISNKSTQNGGGVSASGGNGVYSDSLFLGNSALNGGALSIENATGASLEFNDVNFIGNTATGNGGAVYVNGAINSSVTINASDGTTNLWSDNTANGKDEAIYVGESKDFVLNFNAIGNGVIDINGSITSAANAENFTINKTGTGNLYLSGKSVFDSVGTKINVHEGTFELASDAKMYLNGDNSSLTVKEDAKFVFTVNKDGSALIIGGNAPSALGESSLNGLLSTGTTVEISSDNDIDFSIDGYIELGETKEYKIIENASSIIMNSELNYEYTLLYDVELMLTGTDMSIKATRIKSSVNLPDLDDGVHDILDDYTGGNDFIEIALNAGKSESQEILLAGTQIAKSSGSLQIHNTLLSSIESEIVYSFNSVQTVKQKEMTGRNVPVSFSLMPLMLNSKATHEQGSLEVGSKIRAMGTAFVVDVELPTYFKNGLGVVLGFGGAESSSIGDYASTGNTASFFTTGLYYYMEDHGIKSIFTATYLGLFNHISQNFGESAESDFYSQGLLSSVNVSYDFKFIDFLYVTPFVGVNYLFYHQEAVDTRMNNKTILETTGGSGHNIYIPIGVSVSYDFDLKYDRGIITPLLRLGANIPAYNSGVNTSILVNNNSGELIDNTLNVKEDMGIMDINAELSWRHNHFTLGGDYTFRAFVDHYSHLVSINMKYIF